jgi:hypothetical protein
MTIHDIVTPTFIKILGIIVYALFLATLLVGLLRKKLAPKLKKAYLPLHKTLALVAIALATIHGALVIILFGI